jgi:hypothetical protein
MQPTTTETLMPFAAPMQQNARLLLYTFRRMGAHGLHDAAAANAMMGTFGMSYRRPLIMLRAFMAETARAAEKKITISACCCARMTLDEARLIETIATSLDDPRGASLLLRQAMGCNQDVGALMAAQAVCVAFEDLGHRLS